MQRGTSSDERWSRSQRYSSGGWVVPAELQRPRALRPRPLTLRHQIAGFPPEYADVTAYILSLNGLPSGDDALPSDAAAARRIRIETTGR